MLYNIHSNFENIKKNSNLALQPSLRTLFVSQVQKQLKTTNTIDKRS